MKHKHAWFEKFKEPWDWVKFIHHHKKYGTVRDLESEDFPKALEDNFLKQVVTELKKGANILDLVLTKNENIIGELNIES